MNKLKIILIVIILLAFLSCEQANNQKKEEQNLASQLSTADYQVLVGKDFLMDDQHSYIGFTIKYFGYSPVRGRFNRFDGTLFYDPTRPEMTSASITIDISSINTGNETRDGDLIKEGAWFDIKNYPYAIFHSEKVMLQENGSFDVIGLLTLKGISKPITLHFEQPTKISRDWAKNEQVSLNGKMTLNRKDFGIEGGDFWSTIMEDGLTQLSDEVEMEINLHCRRADYQARYEDLEADNYRKLILDYFKAENSERAFSEIDSLHVSGDLSSGALSTIGYTLIAWNQLEMATQIFQKKKSLFNSNASVLNQLGITSLKLSQQDSAQYYFQTAQKIDTADSRSREYLKIFFEVK